MATVSQAKQKKFPCLFCDFSCNRKSDILIHESTHTGVEPYTCQTCEKSFANESLLKRHKLSHTGEKSFPCKYCKKAFKLKHHLVVHERIHTGRGIYFTISLPTIGMEKICLLKNV